MSDTAAGMFVKSSYFREIRCSPRRCRCAEGWIKGFVLGRDSAPMAASYWNPEQDRLLQEQREREHAESLPPPRPSQRRAIAASVSLLLCGVAVAFVVSDNGVSSHFDAAHPHVTTKIAILLSLTCSFFDPHVAPVG